MSSASYRSSSRSSSALSSGTALLSDQADSGVGRRGVHRVTDVGGGSPRPHRWYLAGAEPLRFCEGALVPVLVDGRNAPVEPASAWCAAREALPELRSVRRRIGRLAVGDPAE